MEETSPLQLPVPLNREKHSALIRIWHWLVFVTISASIIMVLLASTFFKTKDNIPMVQEQVAGKGGVINEQQARAVAHEYSDILWHLHKYIGYVLCFLLLCRIIIEFFQPKEERLAVKMKNFLKLPKNVKEKQFRLLVIRGHLFFYIIFLVMALSGLGLAFEDEPFLRKIHKQIVSVHTFTQYLMYFYILIHIAGVIRADVSVNKGIVSGMINGNKN